MLRGAISRESLALRVATLQNEMTPEHVFIT